MPKPSDVAKKIDRLSEIAINDYGIDPNWIHQISERAKRVNERAEAAGFDSTDVFMGEDGVLAVSSYFKENSLGVAILDTGYEVYVEYERELVDFAVNQTEQQVFSNLDFWGTLWHTYGFYLGTQSIQIEVEELTLIFFGEPKQAESPLLTPIALTPKVLISAYS